MSQFKSFKDMFDGGGAGRSGQRFEGGGLLSDLGNLFARPAGYQDRLGLVRPQMRPIQEKSVQPVQPSTNPMVRPKPNPQSTEERQAPPPDVVVEQTPSFSTGIPQDPLDSPKGMSREVIGRYGKTDLPRSFEDYIDLLPDNQLTKSVGALREEYSRMTDLYSQYIQGFGAEAKNIPEKDLQEGFKGWLSGYQR